MDKIRMLVDAIERNDVRNLFDKNKLFHLIKCKNIQEVKTFFLDNPSFNINDVDSNGTCPLNVAVSCNSKEMVKCLTEHGASVNNRQAIIAPLILAINAGFLEMAELLLDLGANVNEGWLDGEVFPPLHSAGLCLNYKMTKLLIRKGANVNAKHPKTKSSLLHEIGYLTHPHCSDENLNAKCRLKIANLLLQNKADVNSKVSNSINTPLSNASNWVQNVELVKLFIKEGAKLRVEFDNGVMTDHLCDLLRFNNPELVRLCLEHGSDYTLVFEVENTVGSTYHKVLKRSTPEVVKEIWKFGCPIDLHLPRVVAGIQPITPLTLQLDRRNLNLMKLQARFMQGIEENNLKIVSEAINGGAEPKGTSMLIPSPLHHLAAPKGNHEIARILLENGVPVNKISSKHTCLNVAMRCRNSNVIKEILMFGGCFNKYDVEIQKRSKHNKKSKVMQEVLKAFHYTRRGSDKVLKQIKQFCNDGDEDMARAVMNSVDRRGRSLLGMARDTSS